jgi:hypothetical protein
MAEFNGGNRLDDHEQRLARLEAARKELEDSFIVMTHLETKAAARVKEHAEFIASLEAGMKSHELRFAKQEEASALLGRRIDQLVLAIGDLISRIPPSALAQ